MTLPSTRKDAATKSVLSTDATVITSAPAPGEPIVKVPLPPLLPAEATGTMPSSAMRPSATARKSSAKPLLLPRLRFTTSMPSA